MNLRDHCNYTFRSKILLPMYRASKAPGCTLGNTFRISHRRYVARIRTLDAEENNIYNISIITHDFARIFLLVRNCENNARSIEIKI